MLFVINMTHQLTHHPLHIKLWHLLLSGLILGCSAPGIGLWPIAWVGLVPWLIFLEEKTPWQHKLWGSGWVGFGWHLVFCHWMFGLHPLTWTGLTHGQSLAITLSAWGVWALLGGLLWATLGGLYLTLRRLMATLDLGATPEYQLTVLLWVLLWPLAHQGFPLIIDWYVPWADLGLTQIQIPLIQVLASTLPPHSVTMLILGVNSLLAYSVIQHPSQWVKQNIKPIIGIGILLVSFTLSILWQWPAPQGQLPQQSIAMIQGNVPISVIRQAVNQQAVKDNTYIQALQGIAPALDKSTTVLLPEEGALKTPVFLKNHTTHKGLNTLQTIANQHHLHIITGGTTIDTHPSAPAHYYNSLLMLSPQQSSLNTYHKQHLVPFGEVIPHGLFFMPQGWWRTLLTQAKIPYIPYVTAGNGSDTAFKTGKNITIGPLICFELTDSVLSRHHQAHGASWLFNASNLGWFHHQPALAEQFLRYGQLRATETHLPIAIAANSGPSAFIDSTGTIRAKIAPNQSGILYWKVTSGSNSGKIERHPLQSASSFRTF